MLLMGSEVEWGWKKTEKTESRVYAIFVIKIFDGWGASPIDRPDGEYGWITSPLPLRIRRWSPVMMSLWLSVLLLLLQGTRNPKEVIIMTVHDLGCDREYFHQSVNLYHCIPICDNNYPPVLDLLSLQTQYLLFPQISTHWTAFMDSGLPSFIYSFFHSFSGFKCAKSI